MIPRQYTTSKELDRILAKLQHRDKRLYESILTKMNEVITSPDIEHYKNMKYSLKELKRVHVGSFVLVFKYNKQKEFIYFTDFDHHDNIYKR